VCLDQTSILCKDFSPFLKFKFWFDEISQKAVFITSQACFDPSKTESLDLTLDITSRLQLTTLKERNFSSKTWLKSLENKAAVCDRRKCRWNSAFLSNRMPTETYVFKGGK